MSQVIGYLTEERCFLCADSKFTHRYDGEKDFRSHKLFVTENIMITAVGLQFGISLIEGMLDAAKMTGLDTIDEAENYLLSRGQQQYTHFLERHGASLSEELCRLYFIFGGRDCAGRLGLRMVGAESRAAFAPFSLGTVITAPRRPGVEMSLMKLRGESDSVISDSILSTMKKLAALDSGIGEPYLMGMIGKLGSPRIITAS